MRKLKLLIPGFMTSLDRHLLVNHPNLWATKVHYALFFGIIANIISILLGLAFPISIINVADMEMWFTFFVIISIVCVALWVYRFVLFNVEKSYGKRNWGHEYMTFFTAMLCVSVFAVLPFSFTGVLNMKTAKLVDDTEFINDINTLNIGDKYFPESEYYYLNRSDNYQFPDYDFSVYTSNLRFAPWIYMDKAGIINASRMLEMHEQQDTREERLNVITAYITIIGKYGGTIDKTPAEVLDIYEETVRKGALTERSYYWDMKYKVEQNINSIGLAKEGDFWIYERDFIIVTLYFIFYIVIALLIFKSVRWQQFLIVLAVFSLGPILLALLDSFLRHTTHDQGGVLFLFMVIAIYIFCLVQVVISYFHSRFSPFTSVCIMVFALLTPVIGILIVEYLHETGMWRPSEYEYTDAYGNTRTYPQRFDVFRIALWMGPLLYAICLLPVVKESLVRLHSLPRKK